MFMFDRWLGQVIERKKKEPYIILLFGARQTGKSTLIQQLFPKPALSINLANPIDYSKYALQPERFIAECQGLSRSHQSAEIIVDEVQASPALLNAIQFLYDSDKGRWKFILSGSSARKLRQSGANLLPGRVFLLHLYALTLMECPPVLPSGIVSSQNLFPLTLDWNHKKAGVLFKERDLLDRLLYGDLPGIVTASEASRSELLYSYTAIYLEEEVRRECSLRNLSLFAKFLRLAAFESGLTVNHAKLSQQIGLSKPTIKSYYQILEDMFVGFQIEAFSESKRSQLTSTSKFLFFDLGVRHAAADLPIQMGTVLANPGPVFEQWVGIELWKRLQYLRAGKLFYWRTHGGAEIDYIVESHGHYIPVEVKWTENPNLSDARHLLPFLSDHPKKTTKGYIICRCDRPMQIHDKIIALPWFCL